MLVSSLMNFTARPKSLMTQVKLFRIENILALEVSVCDGGFLGDSVNYPLVMEVSQTYIQLQW